MGRSSYIRLPVSRTLRRGAWRLVRARSWLVVMACALSSTFALSAAAPVSASAFEVRVRAKSSLDASVTAAGTLVRVTGSLRDELDRGLPQRKIDVHFVEVDTGQTLRPDETSELYTDRRGGFNVQRELDPGSWRVVVRFDETDHVTASRVTKTVEVAPAPVDLRVQLPHRVIGTVSSVPVHLRASAGGVGLQTTVQVLVNDVEADHVTLDQFGRGTLDIADGLSAGMNEVVVRVPSSMHREVAELTSHLRVSPTIDAYAELGEVVERFQRGVAVEGEIADELGPVDGVRVAVAIARDDAVPDAKAPDAEVPDAEGRPDQRARYERFVTTDDDGRFRAFFPADDIEDGTWHATTTIVPEVGAEISLPTEPLELDRSTSRWVLNALGVLAVGAGILLIIQRLWKVITTRLARMKRERDTRERSERALRDSEDLRPRALSSDQGPIDRAPSKTRLSGLVWDVWKSQPVPDAELVVTGADDEHVLTEQATGRAAGRAGAFILDGLEPGSYTLEVRAQGFMPGRLAFELPHRGHLSNMRLDLVAVPLKIRRLYQSLVESLEGEDLWGRLSPREIEATLVELDEEDGEGDQSRGSPAKRAFIESLRRRLREAGADGEELEADELVAMITAVVEETYFSGRRFDPTVWEFARDIAVELRRRFEEASP